MVVIADLHIGIENELQQQGLHATSQLSQMWYMIRKICNDFKPKNIVLLGDIKHSIPLTPFHEKKQLRSFFEELTKYGIIHIIPGNHDGNIQWYLPDVIILHESDGTVIDSISFIHGHRWPKESLMNSSYLLMGHTHPTIMLQDRLKYESYESCWVRTRLDSEKTKERYSSFNKDIELIILPAFNPLCGGLAVNKDGIMGPMNAIVNQDKNEYFLLDGSFLGTNKTLQQTE
jgi:putative SbcD/Mre11-related phosphoesterase